MNSFNILHKKMKIKKCVLLIFDEILICLFPILKAIKINAI